MANGQGAGRKIAVIDDDNGILESFKELLTLQEFKVTTCDKSTEALSFLKTQAPDLVVLDIRMPGIEGSDLLPLIKKADPDLPVIVVSAYCNETNRNHYRSLGAFDCFTKPFSPEVILDAIFRALDKQQEEIPLLLTSLSLEEGRDHVYRKLILTALAKTNWNQVKAARLLGTSRYSLMRWIKKLGISYK